MSSSAAQGATEASEQEILVAHLSETVRAGLAGDHADGQFIRDRRPSQVLQLGVLPALPCPDPESGETPEQLAQRLRRPPSQLGFTFRLRPDPDGSAAVELKASFSCYLQRYPEPADQRRALGSEGSPPTDSGSEGKPSGKSVPTGSSDLVEIWERFDIDTPPFDVTLELAGGERGSERIDLDSAVRGRLSPALADSKTAYPFRVTQQLPDAACQGSEVDYWQAIREQEGDARDRPLEPPRAAIQVDWRKLPDQTVKVTINLLNLTVEAPRARRKKGEHGTRPRELALFNCRLRCEAGSGAFTPVEFRQAPEDFRYQHLRSVWSTGHNCVSRRAESAEDSAEPILSETWPCYRQRRLVPNPDPALQLRFAELAGEDYLAALRRVGSAMEDFEAAWRAALSQWPDQGTEAACRAALEDFHSHDAEAFARGLRCLQDDPQLAAAFRAGNEVFYRAGQARRTPIEGWRLFQVVYQVIQLAALRAREAEDPMLDAELDRVDVLWFPTGGGKTEAYLGLIIICLFYDRWRGKERGISAILRFPLRMLSVQQLQRILNVLWFAERHRRELLVADATVAGGDLAGDEFLLGYWVGRSNSPNSLVNRIRRDEGDHISYWVDLIKNEPEEAREKRIITQCPNPACSGGDVVLAADPDEVRLRHVCQGCREALPVVISDDEVYRCLPAVLVCTVDKLAHVARAPQFVSILAGPAYRCPKHGYFTFHEAWWRENQRTPEANDRCIAGELCQIPTSSYEAVGETRDPAPALQVQDELHLLEEELGTFNAHYETLLEQLQIGLGSGRPTKLLAATATIEAYGEQVMQLYAREARIFPSPGWKLEESFYVSTETEARRLYVGALPNRPDPREFGAAVQAALHSEIIRMQSDEAYGLRALRSRGLDSARDGAWLQTELLNYELSLGYVNQKRDGDGIANRLARMSFGEDGETLEVAVLASEVATLAKIAEVLNRIDEQYPNQSDRTKRLRALVATSIVSHGVDIDALNLMVINRMTPAVADYVQASSRSGRTHVGLIIVGFDNRSARERSFYEYFLPYHAFLNRLITPVPVNRFAKFAAERTVPGGDERPAPTGVQPGAARPRWPRPEQSSREPRPGQGLPKMVARPRSATRKEARFPRARPACCRR